MALAAVVAERTPDREAVAVGGLGIGPSALLARDQSQEVERARLARPIGGAASGFESQSVELSRLGPMAAHLEEVKDQCRETEDAFPFCCANAKPAAAIRLCSSASIQSMTTFTSAVRSWRGGAWAFRRQMNWVTDTAARRSSSRALLLHFFERNLAHQGMHGPTIAQEPPDGGRHQLFGGVIPVLRRSHGGDERLAGTIGENAQPAQDV